MTTTFPRSIWGRALLAAMVAAALLVMPAVADEPGPDRLAAARKAYLEGKYAEAEEAFRGLGQTPEAVIGQARSQEATGHREKALQIITEGIKSQSKSALLHAESARLAWQGGDQAAAEQAVKQALAIDADQPLARWVQSELCVAGGQLTEASQIYQRIVEYFNQHPVRDPEQLQWIGLAAAEYARWNRLSDQFHFLVNDFYPDLLAIEPQFWRAHYEAGRLFAEKYNFAEAAKEFEAGLVINPQAAEVHAAAGQLALEEFEVKAAAAAADRALEINPQLLEAWHLRADIQFANFEPRAAVGFLNDALKLDPQSEATLGRLAAAYLAVDGLQRTGGETRFGKLASEVEKRNAHAGQFYQALADALDRLRRWPAAARYYQEAITRMPQLVPPRGRLGMMLMRLGEEPQAKQVLAEAFEIDPFNVRVNNTLKVLEVLDGYETLETEHFRIKFDPAHDKILARSMAAWLEAVYPQLVRQMGFSPPSKSLFEVFSKAKNTDGHGWFSARMVGLPHIHPIGACAGKIVALQSPLDGPQRFNWARVLKHEFIHVINLQQTDFNIPHWFTEALATMNEGYPRPQSWNDLLVERLGRGALFDLDSINLGFIRPHSSADWTLAYCQAELYAQYMQEKYGEGAIAKMLASYTDNLTTSEALERALGVSQADFERGYHQYIESIAAQLPKSSQEIELSAAQVQKKIADQPNDPALWARLAQLQLGQRNYPEARRSAERALTRDPKNGLASYVRARLHLLVGENVEALARLEEGLDRDHPQPNLLALLAGLKLKSQAYVAAAEMYELGLQHDPQRPEWLKSLAAVHLKSGDDKRLAEVLARLAEIDADDFPIRKKLAQLAQASGDAIATERWALEALHIDVRDVDVHRWRAEALAAQRRAAEAADEYENLVELAPDNLPWRLALAKTQLEASQNAQAKKTLEDLLNRQPDHAAARQLLESIK